MTEGILGLDLGPTPESATQHVLHLPPSASATELFDLINQVYPEVSPQPPGDGSPVQLTTRTDIHGPDMTPDGGTSWRFTTPRQRGEAPEPETTDADGLYFAFDDGLPEDEELRVVLLLLSLARRLHGQVIFDWQETGGGAQIEPDPDIRIDLTVWSRYRLSDFQLLDVVRSVEPDAVLPAPDASFTGQAPQAEELHPVEHEQVHAQAFAMDAAVLSTPQPEDALYCTVVVPLVDTETPDLLPNEVALDSLAVLAGPPDDSMRPPRGVDHPEQYHCYEIRWSPDDDSQMFTDLPDPAFVESRGYAQFRVRELAHAVVTAVDGIVVDADGFLVDRYTLLDEV